MKIRKSDTEFSNYIRKLDKWTCQRCHRQFDEYDPDARKGLHCSHYWGRGREATRHEPDNCCALCYGCHRLWGHGDGRDEYKAYMIKRLGQKRFDSLTLQANSYKKRDDKMDLIVIRALKQDLENKLGGLNG